MAITYFGSTSIPTDGASATNASLTNTVTPPSSMVVGDLIYVYMQERSTADMSVGVTGGQAWFKLIRRTSTNIVTTIFWARFNGTWAANPRFDFDLATANTVVMIVFRPSASGYAWAIDQQEQSSSYAAPTTPFTVSRAGQTTTFANTVTIAAFASVDDNTWNSLSGTGWLNTSLSAQYRNTSGSDQSVSFAYKIQTATGATGTVTLNQATLGGDAGLTNIISFFEYDPGALYPKQIVTAHTATQTLAIAFTGVLAGSRLYAILGQTDASNFPNVTGGPTSTAGLTWTKIVDGGNATSGNAEIWQSSIYTAGGNETFGVTWNGGSSPSGAEQLNGVGFEIAGQESTPAGATANSPNQTTPSVGITTGRNNSLVIGCVSDWNNNDGITRVIRNNATEVYYIQNPSMFAAYYFFKIVPTAGAAGNFGYSAPSMTGGGATIVLNEIRLPAATAFPYNQHFWN